MREYLFGLKEPDFDAEKHLLTGLIDIFEYPICKMSVPTQWHPLGFGRDKEWNEFDRTTVSCSDTRQSSGWGTRKTFSKFDASDSSLAEI